MKPGEVHLDRADAGDARFEAEHSNLALVPGDEDGVDGDEADFAAHAQRGEQRRLAETDDGDIERAANFEKPGLLEMADHEGVVSGGLRRERDADRLRRAAKFGKWVKQVIRRIETVDLERDAGAGDRVEVVLQPVDVRGLLRRIDEALIPQPGRRGRR